MRGMQQWFNRVAVIALVSLTQTGCIATAMVQQTAAGEPVDRMYFSLTANGEAYQVHRSWGDGASADHHVDRSFSVSRKDLPPACGGRARFFVNDPEHELAIGAWIAAAALTADRAPRPDDRQPPCAVLLAYGAFADSAPAGGVVATLPERVVAIDALQPAHPVLYALWPAAIVADTYLFTAACVLAIPAFIPALVVFKAMDRQARAVREKQEAALPPAVASCWSAAESGIRDGSLPAPAERFDTFRWDPDVANAYTLADATDNFGSDEAIAIDESVVLAGAHVQLRGNPEQWTDAQLVCGLSERRVVTTRLNLRE
jgi:hypothetical protein